MTIGKDEMASWFWFLFCTLKCENRISVGFEFSLSTKTFAPGEARTPDLRISLSVLTYKYDALTDCATGAENRAPAFYGTHCENESA